MFQEAIGTASKPGKGVRGLIRGCMLRCPGECDFIRAAIRVTFAVLAAITRMLTMISSRSQEGMCCALQVNSAYRVALECYINEARRSDHTYLWDL
ncbi:hypothetical protein O997_04330 [Anaplasma phagocytophilum str. MRK]|nr:hypothetical protein O997_04330 [Anaplasma phagocytophilum str. MRK]